MHRKITKSRPKINPETEIPRRTVNNSRIFFSQRKIISPEEVQRFSELSAKCVPNMQINYNGMNPITFRFELS